MQSNSGEQNLRADCNIWFVLECKKCVNTNHSYKYKIIDISPILYSVPITLHFFFVLAGTDTSRYTLCWAIKQMLAFPDIQEKVQDEIDRVVGELLFSVIYCSAYMHAIHLIQDITNNAI